MVPGFEPPVFLIDESIKHDYASQASTQMEGLMPRIGMEPIRRSALVEATIHEIGARGSLDVTVAQIARRAGMSSALAHHYFGSKEQIFVAAMRHILTLYGSEVRGALIMAKTPRERVEAIIRASFTPAQFRPEMVSAWLNFYVQAQRSTEARRLLHIYQRRLRSNLYHAFRQITQAEAHTLTRGLAAMIDGLYIRQALGEGETAPGPAIDVLLRYLDTSLQQSKEPT
ncbi:HTH-type transcriptional regulator BetI [Roseovarius sp. A-2]|nr:HTH-type transcriptional regulator BetI [Roseovarius sp. A-2]